MRNNIEDHSVRFIFITISFAFSNASCNCSLRLREGTYMWGLPPWEDACFRYMLNFSFRIHYLTRHFVPKIKGIRPLFVRCHHQLFQLAIYLSQLEEKTSRIVPLNYICLHSCQYNIYIYIYIDIRTSQN